MKETLDWAEACLLIEMIKRVEEDIRPYSTVAAQLLRMVALEICEIAEETV